MMDYRKLARELVRAVRGGRSQAALSRRLGFRTNVVYTWESGRCSPRVGQFFRYATRAGVSLRSVVVEFYRTQPEWYADQGMDPEELARQLLDDQRRRVPVSQLARATGYSRFALRRWLSGEAEPRLHEFLNVFDACSRRLIDFLAALTNLEAVPSVHEAWQTQQLARHAAYERPWSHAVLRSLETIAYREQPSHRSGWIAQRLRISEQEEQDCLELLSQSKQIVWDGTHYRPMRAAVDLRSTNQAAKALAAWWVQTAAERARTEPGMFAYNVCGIAERDLARLQDLQVSFLKQVRAIVAESEPVEQVALISVQILALDGAGPSTSHSEDLRAAAGRAG